LDAQGFLDVPLDVFQKSLSPVGGGDLIAHHGKDRLEDVERKRLDVEVFFKGPERDGVRQDVGRRVHVGVPQDLDHLQPDRGVQFD